MSNAIFRTVAKMEEFVFSFKISLHTATDVSHRNKQGPETLASLEIIVNEGAEIC